MVGATLTLASLSFPPLVSTRLPGAIHGLELVLREWAFELVLQIG
jgi:hypothetical protein